MVQKNTAVKAKKEAVSRFLHRKNTRFAIFLQKRLGTMWTAYAFTALALVGLLGTLDIFPPLLALLSSWFSQTLIQLVFLPILLVSSSVLEDRSEALATRHFSMTQESQAVIRTILGHVQEQERELLAQGWLILLLLQHQQVPVPAEVAEAWRGGSATDNDVPHIVPLDQYISEKKTRQTKGA